MHLSISDVYGVARNMAEDDSDLIYDDKITYSEEQNSPGMLR